MQCSAPDGDPHQRHCDPWRPGLADLLRKDCLALPEVPESGPQPLLEMAEPVHCSAGLLQAWPLSSHRLPAEAGAAQP